jgi:hypothetical protein
MKTKEEILLLAIDLDNKVTKLQDRISKMRKEKNWALGLIDYDERVLNRTAGQLEILKFILE